MTAVQRDLKQFVEKTSDKTITGTLGALNSDGTYSLQVPGNRGFVYVTYGGPGGFGGHVGVARGFSGGTPGMPVKVKIRDGIGEIVGADNDQLPAYMPGSAIVPTTISPHTHAIGSGMVDPVEGLRILPGVIRPYKEAGAFGLKVWIEPFAYSHDGVQRWWPGQSLDLTAYRPGTASTQAWVIVGIDPDTNTATASTGTEYTLITTMTESLIDGTAFSGLARGAVILRNGQTTINNIREFADLRSHGDVGRGSVNTFVVSTADISTPPTDAELDSEFGTPATVGAGFTRLIDDNGAGANVYLVASDGTNWWYAAMTKAT